LELNITLPPDADKVALFGTADRHLKLIRQKLGVHVVARNGDVKLSGDGPAVNRAAEVLHDLVETVSRGRAVSSEDVEERLSRVTHEGGMVRDADGPGEPHAWRSGQALDVYMSNRSIVARTEGQDRYIEAMRTHDMVFCTGPAGTGKTYLAVAAAVAMLKRGQTRKLVLVRPAVEAGEKLGFLPGDMQQKVNPYLRPLLDSLHDMMPFEQVQRFMHSDLIEVVPLAFMRGRTLNDAVIIMDEGQNTTKAQMQMFLTRLGHGGKMIVTGDTSQIDLPPGETSGLIDAVRRLKRIHGIAFVTLDKEDIVRHSLVQQIVEAYGGERPQLPIESDSAEEESA